MRRIYVPLALATLLASACSSSPGGGGGGFSLLKDTTSGFKLDGFVGSDGQGISDGAPSDTNAADTFSDPDAPDFGNFFDDDTVDDTADAGDFVLSGCPAGSIICGSNVAYTCDGAGGASNTQPCGDVCADGLGCVMCVPGSEKCDETSAQKCSSDGTAWLPSSCDPELGLACDTSVGKCVGACAQSNIGRSYIGCEYWPTVTPNGLLYKGFHFAVAIASASSVDADIVIYQGTKKIATSTVPAGGVVAVNLPWVDALRHDVSTATDKASFDAAYPSVLLAGGAYHLKSTQPVTVSQFNPLEFEIPVDASCPDVMGTGSCNSFTNDASMLLPTNSLGKNYIGVAWPAGGFKTNLGVIMSSPGFLTVVAVVDNTTVHVDATAKIRAGGAKVKAMTPGQSADFVLNAGDVLQLLSASPTNLVGCATQPNQAQICSAPAGYDLTGTKITATAPVQVIGGHDCANVPSNVAACDHVEESLTPVPTWGNSVLVAPPQAVIGAATGNGNADQQLVRVVSAVDGNVLTLDPPVPTLGSPTLKAGGFVDIPLSNKSYQISGTGALQVAQFMAGGDKVDPADSGTAQSKGDPSLSLAVPSSQFRTSYTFLVPDSYTFDFVNVIAETGTAITLDGAPLKNPKWSAIGSTNYSVARVKLNGGNHAMSAGTPFGIVVYGYGSYTSYMYPGGLNLKVGP
jgi:hypothetical protein